MHYQELTPIAQNAYANLRDTVITLNDSPAQPLNGSFAKKIVHGKRYWYFQFRDFVGKVKQIYLGPDSDRVDLLIDQHKQSKASAAAIKQMSNACIALGCDHISNQHFKQLKKLSEHGYFKNGGVLTSDHAFKSICTMLCISPLLKIAETEINIALTTPENPELDAIESLEQGVIPLPNKPQRLQNAGIQIDTQTPVIEYLMVNPQQSIAFSKSGATVVNVPDPVRFAVYQLLSHEIRQASVLIQYFIDYDPEQLRLAIDRAAAVVPGWKDKLPGAINVLQLINESAFDFFNQKRNSTKKSKMRF